MSYIYDDGGLPGEGSYMHRCPVHCDHGCIECAPEEPEVTLDTAPDCPVHGRDWLAEIDGEITCQAPCPSDAGGTECVWYERSGRALTKRYMQIARAAHAIRSGSAPDCCGWINLVGLARDIAAIKEEEALTTEGRIDALVRAVEAINGDEYAYVTLFGDAYDAVLEAGGRPTTTTYIEPGDREPYTIETVTASVRRVEIKAQRPSRPATQDEISAVESRGYQHQTSYLAGDAGAS